MRIIIDAMGGDNAPESVVMGCVNALEEKKGFKVILVGDKGKIEDILKDKNYDHTRLHITHTTEVITNEDIPTKAIRYKKDSSMVVAFKMLKAKQGDVLVSAGNTGALMTGALFILGRIKGIDRPALAPMIPTQKGGMMLIDAGMNSVCRPENYVQFGIMGSIYLKESMGLKNPKVGLINIGSEAKKGNENIKQAYERLSQANINFIGNIEGREIPLGKVDIAVCDGFTGNVLLKFLEGVGSFIFDELKILFTKNVFTKLSALTLKNGLRTFKKKLDYEEYGGTPILGVNGIVFKCHGSSNAKAFKNAIIKASEFDCVDLIDLIKKEFENTEVETDV